VCAPPAALTNWRNTQTDKLKQNAPIGVGKSQLTVTDASTTGLCPPQLPRRVVAGDLSPLKPAQGLRRALGATCLAAALLEPWASFTVSVSSSCDRAVLGYLTVPGGCCHIRARRRCIGCQRCQGTCTQAVKYDNTSGMQPCMTPSRLLHVAVSSVHCDNQRLCEAFSLSSGQLVINTAIDQMHCLAGVCASGITTGQPTMALSGNSGCSPLTIERICLGATTCNI
jgi:hypothetical protein